MNSDDIETVPNPYSPTTGVYYYWKGYTDYWHRLDGPAYVDIKNGTKDWWINDNPVNKQIHEWANEMNIDLDNLTYEDKFMIRLYWENYSE